ncbi:T9SS type A sorting domain-containing protein [Flavobacterium amniphilum]|uniref:choice-of-anchor Q domain-containing protein n=1 Tax=Flavobacterium amniphilum TaxID=1834035 RepID=UPI002029F721|nr:choice-of-anchor Q domain-containing protein [Flavobacterium amniphilum]MCL9805819.1 T9SS type A sorting domain-containing protein [Flavobacterium amniphilum]MCL9806406.1 T9SS type A sorting domain-containing protein [Flavobacterium amniphilum]
MRLQLLFLIAFFCFNSAKAQIPATSLIKDYKFTNGILTSDVSPALQTGTTTLTPTGNSRTIITDRNGETNKAIQLNGDSFSAGGTNAASVNNFAVSFWIKTTTNESPKRLILDQHNTAANPAGFSASLKDGKIYFNGQYSWNFQSTSGASGVQEVVSQPVNDGQWHHVVCQLSSTSSLMYAGSLSQYTLTYTYSMYIDNVYVGADAETNYASGLTSENYTVRTITPNNPLVIGKSHDSNYLDYRDGIDQIRYYERTLSSPEIDILFNEDKPAVKIYVNSNATGANNGTSWTDAYTNLETAITTSTSVNEIWVAAGIYKPSGAARNSTFLMKNALKMYGGFDGTETQLSQRNPKTNLTILNGDINGNDNSTITATEATRQDNAYHVITVKGNIRNVVVDGFTITGGNANGPTLTSGTASAQYYHTRGGAVYINTYNSNDNASILIRNCILEKNSGSDTGVLSGYFAGGVNNQIFTANLESTIIRENHSGSNAQILISGANGFSWYGNSEIKNCLFHNNTSGSGASSLYLSASTANSGNQNGINVDVINTTFSGNAGNAGNVIRTDNGSNTRFKNCIIYGNGSNVPFFIGGTLGGPSLQNTISQGGQISGINSNPLLNSNYTLQSGSPAIDTGNNVFVPAGLTLDLNGNTRIVNSTVDMGAFEFDASLGTDNHSFNDEIIIYPNPTNGIINIKTTEPIKKVDLYSTIGLKLFNGNISVIDFTSVPNGIYLLIVETNEGKIFSRQIIKN